MSVFYGLVMKANFKYTQYVTRSFHVSNVSLDHGGHAKVYMTFENRQFLMASMSKKVPQVPLDLNFSAGDRLTFNVEGDGKVSMMGYILNPQPDPLSEEEEGIYVAAATPPPQQKEQQQQQKLPRARRTGHTRASDDEEEDKCDDNDDEDDECDDNDDNDEEEIPDQVLKDVANIVASCDSQASVDHCQAASSMVDKPRATRSSLPDCKKQPKLCKFHARLCVMRAKRKRDTSPEKSCQWKRYKDSYYK